MTRSSFSAEARRHRRAAFRRDLRASADSYRRHRARHHARPPLPIFFIMSAIWRCILRSLLTSETSTPAPAAMRLLREPLITSGSARSVLGHRLDDGFLAGEDLVVEARRVELVLDLADAGQHAQHALHAAQLLHLVQLRSAGRSYRTDPSSFWRRASPPSSLSSVSTAFSTSETTSPMSRMRQATRCGMEGLQRVELFAGAQELDRRAGDRAHGQRRAAAADRHRRGSG